MSNSNQFCVAVFAQSADSFLTVGKYQNSNMVMDSVHPIGQTKYRNVKFGQSGKIRYTQTKRSAHMKINVAIVVTIGFPMPFNAAPIISLIPQMKYVLEMITIFCCEYAMTVGSLDIIEESCPENMAESAPKVAPKPIVINIPLLTAFVALFMFPTPTFWLT